MPDSGSHIWAILPWSHQWGRWSYQERCTWIGRRQPWWRQLYVLPAARCHWYRYCSSGNNRDIRYEEINNMQKQYLFINQRSITIYSVTVLQLPHTQKSRLYFMFLKSPPTIAARWITWVGWCFLNTASVSSMFLRRSHINTIRKCRGGLGIESANAK